MVNYYKNGGYEDDVEDDSYRNSNYFHSRNRTTDNPMGRSTSCSCNCPSLSELRENYRDESCKIKELIPDAFLYFHGQASAAGHSSFMCSVFRVVVFLYWTFITAVVLGTAFEFISLPSWFTNSEANVKLQSDFFIFLTNWTVCILWFYLCIAMCNSLFVRGRSKFYNRINFALRTIALVATCMVFLLYWTLEYPQIGSTNYIDTQLHAMNFFIMLLDLTFCRVPFFLKHCWMPLIYLIVYLIFSLVYYLAGGINPLDGSRNIYPVLDYSKPLPTAILILLVLCIGYPLVITILWIYGKWTKKAILANSPGINGYYTNELEDDGFLVTPFLSAQSSDSSQEW